MHQKVWHLWSPDLGAPPAGALTGQYLTASPEQRVARNNRVLRNCKGEESRQATFGPKQALSLFCHATAVAPFKAKKARRGVLPDPSRLPPELGSLQSEYRALHNWPRSPLARQINRHRLKLVVFNLIPKPPKKRTPMAYDYWSKRARANLRGLRACEASFHAMSWTQRRTHCPRVLPAGAHRERCDRKTTARGTFRSVALVPRALSSARAQGTSSTAAAAWGGSGHGACMAPHQGRSFKCATGSGEWLQQKAQIFTESVAQLDAPCKSGPAFPPSHLKNSLFLVLHESRHHSRCVACRTFAGLDSLPCVLEAKKAVPVSTWEIQEVPEF